MVYAFGHYLSLLEHIKMCLAFICCLKEFIINDLFSSVIFVKHLRIHLHAGPVTRFGTMLFVEILLYSSPEALCFLTKFLFQG